MEVEKYTIFSLLRTKTADVDELVNKSPDLIKVPTLVLDEVEKFVEVMTKVRYKDINELRDYVAGKLSSDETDFVKRLHSNLLNFSIFELLLAKIKYFRKPLGIVGSVFRKAGSLLRGRSEFTNLQEAIEKYENKSSTGYIGNILRGTGETFSGERESLQRVLNRTVEGVNPFKKLVRIDDSRAKDPEILVSVCHSLMLLFEGKYIAGCCFLEYLYNYVFKLHTTKISSDFYDDVFYQGIGKYVFFNLLALQKNKKVAQFENERMKFIENCLSISELFDSIFKFDNIKVDTETFTFDDMNRLRMEHPELSKKKSGEITAKLVIELKERELRTKRKRDIFAHVFNMNANKILTCGTEPINRPSPNPNPGNQETEDLKNLEKHFGEYMKIKDTKNRVMSLMPEIGDSDRFSQYIQEHEIENYQDQVTRTEEDEGEDEGDNDNDVCKNTLDATSTDNVIEAETVSLSESGISGEFDLRVDSAVLDEIHNEMNIPTKLDDNKPEPNMNTRQGTTNLDSPLISPLINDDMRSVLGTLNQEIEEENNRTNNENNYSFVDDRDENNSPFFRSTRNDINNELNGDGESQSNQFLTLGESFDSENKSLMEFHNHKEPEEEGTDAQLSELLMMHMGDNSLDEENN